MYDIDLAREDELTQNFTPQDVEDIKSAIDVPRANVTILNTVYSPEETKIGVWREYRTVDNEQVLMEKPVYAKTLFGLGITTKNSDWVTIGTYDYIEKLVGLPFTGFSFNGSSPFNNITSILEASINESTHVLQISTTYARTIDQLTLHYTKTTDEWQEVTQ